VGPSSGLNDLGGQRLATPPIRGRAGELKVIGALLTALVQGRGGVLVIEGPPGIGKSRLLTEVMALADKGGVRTLFGEAFEYQQTVPFFSLFSEASVSAVADRLYCHPNTVRHRLRRIEKHTGRSLSRPRDVAELCLAFEVHRRLM
jgi:predicted ATPase